MEWTELRRKWQAVSNPEAEGRMARTPPLVSRLRRRIVWRDVLESAAAALMAPLFLGFAWLAFSHHRWLVAAFSAFTGAAVLYVPWRLWRERRKLPQVDPERPVKEYLRDERAAMLAQAELVESVWWWYLGPLYIGAVGIYASIRGLVWQSLVYAVVVLLFYLAIGKANTVAARKQFRVAVARIDEELDSLEEEDRDDPSNDERSAKTTEETDGA